MNPLALVIPPWAKWAAAAVVIIGLAAAVYAAMLHQQKVGAAQAVAASQEAARKEGDRRLEQQSENLNEYARLVERQGEAGAALDASARRVRDAAARGRLAPRPAAAASGAASGVPGAACVSADVFGRVVEASRQLARRADCLASGGKLCAADYDALSARP